MRRLRQFLLSFSLVVLFASNAGAQGAAALKAEGDAAFLARRYSEAIAAYDRAYAIGHDATVLYNKARAHEALEQFPEALAAIEQFEAEAPPELRAKVSGLSTLVADIRSHVASLAVICNVAGARVTVRDLVVGETSLAAPLRVKVNRGRARVVVEKDGYTPFSQDLNLPGESSTNVNAVLDPKVPAATLTVRSTPTRASLAVDGRPMGLTPAELDIAAGTHRVELEHDGYAKLVTSVTVDADKPRTLDLQMSESSSLATRWWFWTGIGGIVVAGVAVMFIALQEADPPAGSIAPGTVSAPLLRWGR